MEVQEDILKDTMENTEKAYTVYNASGWNMNETVALSVSGSCSFTDEEGNLLVSQDQGDVAYVQVTDVPAMGHKTIFVKEGRQRTDTFQSRGKKVGDTILSGRVKWLWTDYPPL